MSVLQRLGSGGPFSRLSVVLSVVLSVAVWILSRSVRLCVGWFVRPAAFSFVCLFQISSSASRYHYHHQHRLWKSFGFAGVSPRYSYFQTKGTNPELHVLELLKLTWCGRAWPVMALLWIEKYYSEC